MTPDTLPLLGCQSRLPPEHTLLVAILEQAASDLRRARFGSQREAQKIYLDAYRWVMSDDRSHVFSFVNVCETLKLSPEALRAGLSRLAFGAVNAGVER